MMALRMIGDSEKAIIRDILHSNQYFSDIRRYNDVPINELIRCGYLQRFRHDHGTAVTLTHEALDFMGLYADPDPATNEGRIWRRDESVSGQNNYRLDFILKDVRSRPYTYFGPEFRPSVLVGSSM